MILASRCPWGTPELPEWHLGLILRFREANLVAGRRAGRAGRTASRPQDARGNYRICSYILTIGRGYRFTHTRGYRFTHTRGVPFHPG